MFRLPEITPVSGVYPPQMFANMNDPHYTDIEPLFIPPFPRQTMSEESRFVKREIQLKDNKLTEDVYTYESRNGEKREKQTHRVIPLRKWKSAKTLRHKRKSIPKPASPLPKPVVVSTPTPTPTPAVSTMKEEDIRDMLTPAPLTKREPIIMPTPTIPTERETSSTTTTTNTRPVSSIDDRMPTPYPKTFTDNIRFMKTTKKRKAPVPSRRTKSKTQSRRQQNKVKKRSTKTNSRSRK